MSTEPAAHTMPEHVARTHTQRALHSLLLDDNESARMYLLRALSSLNGQNSQRETFRAFSSHHPSKCTQG